MRVRVFLMTSRIQLVKVDKPSNFLIKTSNVAEYIKSNIQNIETLRIDDPII